MNTFSALRLLPALAVLALVGCPNDQGLTGDSNAGADACTAPSLDPLENQTVTLGDTVVIKSVAKACNDAHFDYVWSMDSAPLDSQLDISDLTITEPAEPYFTPDVVGDYVISAYVVDAAGNKSAVAVAVITVQSGNEKPLADCGENQTAKVGDRVMLDGSASHDPEGAALTYQWALSSGPDGSGLSSDDVFNGDQVSASVVPDVAGVYVVSLVVSDGENYSDADYCSITVGSDNSAPIADAGQTATLSPCTPPDFHLDGWGSYDPDGDPLTYQWSLLSSPDGTGYFADDSTKADPYFHWSTPGDYTFQLQVCDPYQCSAPDVVTYTFVDPSENTGPVANAGEDQTIDNEPDCSTASYVWTCEDCPSDKVTLDGSASIDEVDGDELDFYWKEATGELTLSSPTSVTTEAVTPSFASTYNTTITKTWTVDLTVSDCSESDTDSVTVTYTCTGSY